MLTNWRLLPITRHKTDAKKVEKERRWRMSAFTLSLIVRDGGDFIEVKTVQPAVGLSQLHISSPRHDKRLSGSQTGAPTDTKHIHQASVLTTQHSVH